VRVLTDLLSLETRNLQLETPHAEKPGKFARLRNTPDRKSQLWLAFSLCHLVETPRKGDKLSR